jgi:hypothetical protein
MKDLCRYAINPVWLVSLDLPPDGGFLYSGCEMFISPLNRPPYSTYNAGEILHYQRYKNGTYIIYYLNIKSMSFINDDYEGLLTEHYFMNLESPDGSIWRCTPWRRGFDPDHYYCSDMREDRWVAREELHPADR